MRTALSILGKTLVFAVLLLSCAKEEFTPALPNPSNMVVYADTNLKYVLGAVAGDEVALLVYVNDSSETLVKLVDNQGEELWTKPVGYRYVIPEFTNNLPHVSVLLEEDQTFSVFYGSGIALKRFDLQGNVVFQHDSLLNDVVSPGDDFQVVHGHNGDYLVIGANNTYQDEGAFIAEYNREGFLKSSNSYLYSLFGTQGFTNVLLNDDGSYTLAGSFVTNSMFVNDRYFVADLSSNGELSLRYMRDMPSCRCSGREFIEMENGRYGYLLSPYDAAAIDKRSRFYVLSDTGSILDSSFMDLAPENYSSGRAQMIGGGLVLNQDGGYSGLMKGSWELPQRDLATFFFLANNNVTYRQPQYSYRYSLTKEGKVENQKFITTEYSNYFSSLIRLSDGKLMLFGFMQSFGREFRLTTMII